MRGRPAVALWRDCGLLRPWTDPHRDIARKLRVQPECFLVATMLGGGGVHALVGAATGARCTTLPWPRAISA